MEAYGLDGIHLSIDDVLLIEELSMEERKNKHTDLKLTALLKGKCKDDIVHEIGEIVK